MKSFAHIDDETRVSNFRVILTMSVPFIVTFALLANVSIQIYTHHGQHDIKNLSLNHVDDLHVPSLYLPKKTPKKTLNTKHVQFCKQVKGCSYSTNLNATSGMEFPLNQQKFKILNKYLTRSETLSTKERLKYATKLQPVTGFSSNHYLEHKKHVESALLLFPKSKVLVYDLGLTYSQVSNISKHKRLIYRKFNFEKYPQHVSVMYTYAWKIMIAMEVLHEFGNIFWFDTSIDFPVRDACKFNGTELNGNTFSTVSNCKNKSWLNFALEYYSKMQLSEKTRLPETNFLKVSKKPPYFKIKTNPVIPILPSQVESSKNNLPSDILWYMGHSAGSVIANTYQNTFNYLPSDPFFLSGAHREVMHGGAFIMYNTQFFKWNFMKWAILCALTKDCIAPKEYWDDENREISYHSKICPKKFYPMMRHVCHRTDQSLMSLLAYNLYRDKEIFSWSDEFKIGKAVRKDYVRSNAFKERTIVRRKMNG